MNLLRWLFRDLSCVQAPPKLVVPAAVIVGTDDARAEQALAKREKETK